MKKTKKLIMIVFSGILLIALGLYIAGNLYYTHARIYEENWKIALPSDLRKLYGIKSATGPHGDGLRYTIYELKDADAPFLEGASLRKNTEMQDEVIKILNDLRADKQKYPNFSNTYKWKILSKYSDKLYMIYDTKSSYVYFVQNIP